MARFFVTGGAGYVGSHCVLALIEGGHDVTVYDNLKGGHRAAVPDGARLIVADLADAGRLEAALGDGRYDAVFHFAGLIAVGESMREPFLYLRENAVNGVSLVEAAVRHGIRKFVFSSTAALYAPGVPVPIAENAPLDPESAYGDTKWMTERTLRWADRVHGLRSACLRYFNAAGADPAGRAGEDHDPETHLIPLAIDAALGRRPDIAVFGDDYPTRDGTCIRDYIHVADLAAAHLAVLPLLDLRSGAFNLGNGRGYSVREVIDCAERVSGRRVPVRMAPRRAGDAPALVASSEKLRRETGWTPRFADLETIVRHAMAWREAHPRGYGDKERTAAAAA